MFKSVQIKIILIVVVLALVMFAIPGYLYINYLDKVDADSLNTVINNGKLVFSIIAISFLVISLVIIIFASKIILNPITKLIKSAEKFSDINNTEKEFKYFKGRKSKTEMDELYKAFNLMTTGLKENLNEVTRQKKQIETILLHMTDGIIAFNIDGEIIHINPAATRLLRIDSKEDTFEKIFKRLKVDINLEKLIYLENWTSTEEKINIDETYLNMFFAPFKDENDRPAGIMVLIQDITEHVKLDNMRKEFVADVSHELKTPLTSIMGYAETLATTDYDKDLQDKFLNVISSEAVRMTKLVNDLLELSKNDSGEERLYFEQNINIKNIIEETAKENGIEIKKGIYAQLTGPSFESPAEIQMFHKLGIDAVGMSTVVEAIAANHMGMKICCISFISNLAAGMNPNPLTHEEVQEAANEAAPRFKKLVTEVVKKFGEKCI